MGECSVLHALTWLKRATNATNASNAFATALTGKTWPLQNSMTLLALYTLHTATYWCWPYSTQWLVNAQKHKMTSTCRALTAQYTKETTWHQHVPAARNLLVNYSETASGNAAILMSAAKSQVSCAMQQIWKEPYAAAAAAAAPAAATTGAEQGRYCK